jgi:hypothetical protein
MQNTETRKRLINSAAEFVGWLNSSNSDREEIRKNRRAASSRSRGSAFETFRVLFPLANEFARSLIRPLMEVTLGYVRKCQKQKRKSERFRTFEEYVDNMAPLLHAIEKRYPTQPAVGDETFGTGRPTFVYELIPKGRRDRGGLDFEKSRILTERLNLFFLLGREGAFAAFHRCALPTCGNYFHALRPERRYCSKRCQRNQYMEHPLRTKKNAADQKVYYYTRKILDLVKVKAVNAAHQKAYERAEKALKSAKRAQKALTLAMRAVAKGH